MQSKDERPMPPAGASLRLVNSTEVAVTPIESPKPKRATMPRLTHDERQESFDMLVLRQERLRGGGLRSMIELCGALIGEDLCGDPAAAMLDRLADELVRETDVLAPVVSDGEGLDARDVRQLLDRLHRCAIAARAAHELHGRIHRAQALNRRARRRVGAR